MADQISRQPSISLETATWLFDRASFALIASLVVGAIATGLIVWMGIVKEHHWDLLREANAEKTAQLELETAKTNKEAALARLATEKLRQRLVWRLIDPDAAKKLTETMKPFAPVHFSILTYTDDPEASNLAGLLRKSLEDANWTFSGIGSLLVLQSGVWLAKATDSDQPVDSVIHPLTSAMKDAGVEPQGLVVGWPQLDRQIIYIVIGRKPPSGIEIPALDPPIEAK